MQPFHPHLFVESTSLGPHILHVAVNLPDDYRLGTPSGPNQNGELNLQTQTREIDIPILPSEGTKHAFPQTLIISIAKSEIDLKQELYIGVNMVFKEIDPPKKPRKSKGIMVLKHLQTE